MIHWFSRRSFLFPPPGFFLSLGEINHIITIKSQYDRSCGFKSDIISLKKIAASNLSEENNWGLELVGKAPPQSTGASGGGKKHLSTQLKKWVDDNFEFF